MPTSVQVQRVLCAVVDKVDQVPVPTESPARTAIRKKNGCEDFTPDLKNGKKSIAYQAYCPVNICLLLMSNCYRKRTVFIVAFFIITEWCFQVVYFQDVIIKII